MSRKIYITEEIDRHMGLKIITLLLAIALIPSISALTTITDLGITTDGNYSGDFFSNKTYWSQIENKPDLLNSIQLNSTYLNLSGTNANQNINIGVYNFSMGENLILSEDTPTINFSDHGSILFNDDGGHTFEFNHGVYINGDNGFLDVQTRLLVGEYAHIDEYLIVDGNLTVNNNSSFEGHLIPLTTLTWDIGSGSNRWRKGYFQNISADYVDITYDLNVDGNITADNIDVSGDISIDGNITVIDTIRMNVLNVSFIRDPYYLGSMDMRGDPWWLAGVDLQIAENLIVDGNISGDYVNANNINVSNGYFQNITVYDTSFLGDVEISSDIIKTNVIQEKTAGHGVNITNDTIVEGNLTSSDIISTNNVYVGNVLNIENGKILILDDGPALTLHANDVAPFRVLSDLGLYGWGGSNTGVYNHEYFGTVKYNDEVRYTKLLESTANITSTKRICDSVGCIGDSLNFIENNTDGGYVAIFKTINVTGTSYLGDVEISSDLIKADVIQEKTTGNGVNFTNGINMNGNSILGISGGLEEVWIELGQGTGTGFTQIGSANEISMLFGGTEMITLSGDSNKASIDMHVDLTMNGEKYSITAGNGTFEKTETTGEAYVNELIITSPSQDYKFFARDTPTDHLQIQAQTSGKGNYFQMFTKDGDATDSNFWEIWGKGLPDSTTNRERILIGWDRTRNVYKFSVDANGAGTSRPLVFETDENAGQVTLNTDGSTKINGELDVENDIIIGTGSSWTDFGVCYLSTGKLGHCTQALNSTGAGCGCTSN